MDLSLNDLIRAEIAKTSGPVTTHGVATAVLHGIPDDELRARLDEALPEMVRLVIGATRMRIDATGSAPATGGSRTPSSKSWKRDGIKAAEEKRLNALDVRYATEDGYKRLAEFTYAELVALADTLQAQAEKNLAKADRFRRVAAVMHDAGAGTLGEVAETVLPMLDNPASSKAA